MSDTKRPSPETLLPLSVPVFQILLSLAEKDRHGYGIIGDIRRRSRDEVVLSTSTLYGAIKRMMRDGLVDRSDMRPDPELDDERRRYYRITDFGKEVAASEAQRISRLADMVRNSEFATRAP
jgi:DNA-binding PadR family transcriptional regulator